MAKAKHKPSDTKLTAAHRGVLLGALIALTAPKDAPAAPATVERVDAAADALTTALAELHSDQ